MNKSSLILAALVLFTSASFASNVKQDDKSKAKTEKKAPVKSTKGTKASKTTGTKTKTAPADKK